jgi:hypothetical protein
MPALLEAKDHHRYLLLIEQKNEKWGWIKIEVFPCGIQRGTIFTQVEVDVQTIQ